MDDHIRREFGLVAVWDETHRFDAEWVHGRERELRGWRELAARCVDDIWNRYSEVFGSPPSRGFCTPSPSLTWDISRIYIQPPTEFTSLEADLTTKVFRALKPCTRPGERLYALDWNHPCYLFDPHHPGATAGPEPWPVPVLPNGDHDIFLAPDLRFGVVGDCVTQTMCVFGQQLLDLLLRDLPQVFDRPTWTAEDRRELRAGWERLGWCGLNGKERDEMIERLDFHSSRPPAEGPCFREPVPSIVWDITELLTAGSEHQRQDFTLRMLAAFRCVMPLGGRMLAFDATRWFEHYSFDPRGVSGSGREQWALPVVPDGGYAIFVATDFTFGMVGNSVERTLCVFGRPLIDAVLADPPAGLGTVVRRDGEAVTR